MRSRGQIFTWDLVFSMALFAVTLTAVFYLWNSTSRNLQSSEEYYDMGWLASMIGEQLVRLPGVPQRWTADDVLVVGLAEDETIVGLAAVQDRVISPRKFLTLVNMSDKNYAQLKSAMVRAVKYDFYMNFSCRSEDGDPLQCFKDLSVDGMDGVVHCENGLSITIKNNKTSTASLTPPPGECVIGRHLPLSEMDYVASNVKNAVFSERPDIVDPSFDRFQELNKTLTITVVVYREVLD